MSSNFARNVILKARRKACKPLLDSKITNDAVNPKRTVENCLTTSNGLCRPLLLPVNKNNEMMMKYIESHTVTKALIKIDFLIISENQLRI